mmetsp:Transcript_16337/g.30106  ORF Transcript_16337/g.30106 Transcript_16337/m.30106 type:complete len:351 (-) Transcript_16337:218-1270(-)
MLSNYPLVVFTFHAVVSNIAAVIAADSTSKEDGGTVTKGTMLYQSATKVFAAVQPGQLDDFDDLLDEFDSDSKPEVRATGAQSSKMHDEAYAIGAEALPAMLQDLKTTQRAAPSAWYKPFLYLLSCSGFFGCFQDFFFLIVGAVGYYYLWKGYPLHRRLSFPRRRLSSDKPASCAAAAAKKSAEAKLVDMDELVQAMYSDNKEYLQKLLQERSADASEEVWGCTALHVAAHCGCAPAAEALLRRGASANMRDTWDETPMHFAARSGSTEVCQLLITSGADLNAINARDWTPLVVAADARNEAVCELLLANGATAGGLPDKELPPLLTSLLVRQIFKSHDQITSSADPKLD